MNKQDFIDKGVEYCIKQFNDRYEYSSDLGHSVGTIDLVEEYLINNAPNKLDINLWYDLFNEILEKTDKAIYGY